MRPVYLPLLLALLGLPLHLHSEPLRGSVLEDHTGRPVIFAGIRVLKADRRPALAAPLLTDLNGRFVTPDLPPGDYDIEAYHQDYLTTSVRLRTPAPALTLRLAKLATIWGRVLDLEGRPNPGARVAVMYKPAQGLVLQPYGPPLPVNRDGQFRASGLPPGEYAVAVLNANPERTPSSPNLYYYPRNERPQFFAISGGEQYSGVDFRIPAVPRFRLSGNLPPSGEAGRAVVVLYWPEQPLLPVASARSLPGGRWSLDQVPYGEYLLLAIRPTLGFGSQGGMLSPDDVLAAARVVVDRDLEDLRISLPPARELALSVVSLSPEPETACPEVAPVVLAPLQPPGSREPVRAAIPLNRPSLVTGVLPGRYRVTAALGDRCFLASAPQLEVPEDGQPKAITLEITPGVTLRGRVQPGGAAPEMQSLVVLLPAPQSPPGPARVTRPDAGGRFIFENLAPGPYRIALRRVDASPHSRWFPPLTQTFELRIPPGPAIEAELEPPPPRYR